MPDYDLGRAHGRIVIDHDDRGAAQAEQSLNRLRAMALSLRDAMSRVRDSGFGRAVEEISSRSRDAAVRVRDFSRSLFTIVPSTAAAVSELARLTTQMGHLGAAAVQTSNRVAQLHENLRMFTSVGGAISGLASRFSDLDERLSRMPQWARQIVQANVALRNMAVTGRLLRGLGASIGAAVLPTAGFLAAAVAASNASRRLRLLAATAAMVFPSLNSAAMATRVFGASIASVVGPAISGFAKGMTSVIRGASQAVIGFTLIQKGFTGVVKAAQAGAIAFSAMGLAAAGLKVVGTVVLGAANALKQLSGAALILPGALMAMGIAGGVAAAAFKSVGEAFKAGALEGDEFTKATEKMSPVMKDVALASQSMYKDVKTLKEIASDHTFRNFGDDIRELGEAYMPMLKTGVRTVGDSLNRVKDGFRDFLAQPATVQDLNKAFAMTGTMLDNVSEAVWPFMAAMRDIGMVGMEVMTELSGGIGSAASKFGMFISEARRTGELKQWILDGIQGFKDLGASIVAAGSGIKTIFESFGASGDNALARLRKNMEGFRDAMQDSADGGTLEHLATSLNRMGDTAIETIKVALEQIGKVLQKLAPFAEDVSAAFEGGLKTAFQVVGAAAQVLASALGAIPGAGAAVGTILALGVAVKALGLVLTPATRALQVMAGSFMLVRGASTAIGGAATAVTSLGARAVVAGVQMGAFGSAIAAIGTRVGVIAAMQTAFLTAATAATRFGRTAGIAAAAMTGLGRAASGALALIGGPIGASIIAIVGALMSMKAASDAAAASQEALAQKALHAKEGYQGLVDAFMESGGVVNDGVIAELGSQLETLTADLETTAGTTTGFMADLGAALLDTFNWDAIMGRGGWTKANDDIDAVAERSKYAAQAIKDLGMSQQELTQALSTQGGWDSVKSQLQGMGEWGRYAIDELAPMRQRFAEIQSSMAAIGPESVTLAGAFQTLADASSSSADRLGALRSALQALGILETDATEEAFKLSETIREVGNAAGTAFEQTGDFGNALLNETGNGFNTSSENAKILHDELKRLGEGLMSTAAAGGDVSGKYGEMQAALDALSASTGLTRAEIDMLGRTVGIAPSELNLLVSLKGASEAKTEISQVLAELGAAQGQTATVTAIAKTTEAQDALRQLGFNVEVINAQTGEVRVTGNTEDARTKLGTIAALAQQLGLTNPQVNVGTNAPQVNTELNGVKTNALTMPSGITIPLSAPGAAQAQAETGGILGNLQAMPGATAAAVQAPGAATAQQEVGGLQAALQGIVSPPPAQVTVSGIPEIQGQIDGIAGSLTNSLGQWNAYSSGISSAMSAAVGACQTAAASCVAALNGAAGGAFASGSSLGAGFAAGIQSQVGAVAAAAAALAEAASAPLPNSPAKIGPFSGKGWTPFRGRELALGFASGIADGIPAVRDISLALAEAVAQAIDVKASELGWNQVQTDRYQTSTKTEAQLKAENDKKIAEELEKEARAEKKKQQQDAKKDAKKTAEERADEAKKAEGDAKKTTAKEARESEEQIQQKQMDEALKLLERGNGTQEQINDAINTVERNTTSMDEETKQALRVIGSQDSTAAETLYAIEKLDGKIASIEDIETQDYLEQVKQSAMQRKGIEEYDPLENASTDVPGDVVKVIGDVFSIIQGLEDTLKNLMDLTDLLVRGPSSTKDLEKIVDGFQGVVSGVADIADTVGGVLSTAANIAAAFGSVIPGIGPIVSTIGAVTGGISAVNGVIDLIQQGFKFAGRIAGGFLSMLAGGKDGALYGNIRTLIDTNDGTIKRWSTANPDDKRVTQIGRGNGGTTNNTGVNNLNIYSGPGTDPYEMANEMMFAIRAANNGAYA